LADSGLFNGLQRIQQEKHVRYCTLKFSKTI
jgi:hypothetical protein